MLKPDIDYGVRVIRAFEHRRVGQVFFPPGVLRQRMIQVGLVEPVQPPDQPEPPADPQPPIRKKRTP